MIRHRMLPVTWSVTLLVVFLLVSSGARAEWVPNDAQQEALDAINEVRKGMGLPLYTLDERLCRAAAAHSAFADKHVLDHEERPGLSGFTGATAADRARAVGYDKPIGEVMNYHLDSMGVTNAVREWIDTPYHRYLWMKRGPAHVGVGVFKSTITVDFFGFWQEGTVVYPYDGQKDVPPAWSKGETPDPRRLWGLPKSIGYPISFHWEAPRRDEMTIASTSLTDPGGRAVEHVLNTRDNDSSLKDSDDVVLLPKRPLKPQTTYTVKVVASTKSGKDISREWKFTTGSTVITDRRESHTEEDLKVAFTAEPGTDGTVVARVINRDPVRRRAFTVKVRNATGGLLASGRLRVDPSSMGAVTLAVKEEPRTVVLVPEWVTPTVPVSRQLILRVGGWNPHGIKRK